MARATDAYIHDQFGPHDQLAVAAFIDGRCVFAISPFVAVRPAVVALGAPQRRGCGSGGGIGIGIGIGSGCGCGSGSGSGSR